MHLKKTTKILIAVCVIGLCLLLYPTVSNYWNEKHSTKAINSYVESIEKISDEQYVKLWTEAVAYNEKLKLRENQFQLPDELKDEYESRLNINGDGIIGYIEISKLGVSLPLYHGTSDTVLQRAIGHIDWTSLPTGGEGTHCAVSGHRGLPSAKLFTELDKLREGDLFVLTVLNETLTYEVDQIRVVEPDDASDLLPEQGKDYCTLVTCTPYGINTHRLLVRGHRVESVNAGGIHIVSEAVIIDPLIVAPVVAFPILLALLLIVLFKKPESKKKTGE